MKKEKKKRSVWVVIVCLLVGLGIGWMVGRLFMYDILLWMFKPVELSYSESAKADIHEYLGAEIPSDARFLEGWVASGKDSTYFYCFELDFQGGGEVSADTFLRNALGLDENDYADPISEEDPRVTFAGTESQYGCTFTQVIRYMGRDLSEIHYAVVDDTIVFACIYGI